MTLTYSPIVRRILFFSVITIFFLSSTILIIHSFGYRYSFEKGIFIYTGSITLKTNPQQVTIAINGEGLEKSKKLNYINSSQQINSLRPGKYHLDIKSPGFQTWSKNIIVESGKSTEFWNVLLPRETYETQDIDLQNIIGMYPSPNSDEVAVARFNGEEFSIDILDTDTLLAEKIFSSTTYTRPEEWKHNIEWSPDNEMLLIPVIPIPEKNNQDVHLTTEELPSEILLLDRETNQSQQLSSLFLPDSSMKRSFYDIRWGSGNNDIYSISGTSLIVLEEKGSREWERRVIFENVLSFNFTASHIYLLKENGMIYEVNKDFEDERQVTTSQPQEFDSKSRISLVMYDEHRGVIHSQEGKLWIWNKGKKGNYFHLQKENIQGTQFSNDGKKILFWSDTAIWVYFTRDWESQPNREENTFIKIANFLSPISNISWMKQYEHILYTFQGSLYVVELDQRDRRITSKLSPSLSEKPIILQIFNKDMVFFSKPNETNGNILSSFLFPEEITFFGF